MTELGIGHVLSMDHDAESCRSCIHQRAKKRLIDLIEQQADTMLSYDCPDLLFGEFDSISIDLILKAVLNVD